MTNRELTIHLDLEMRQPGPNRHWGSDTSVEVPPDYAEQDILPFVRWQLDMAVAQLQREEMDEARSAAFLAAFDLRLRVIGHLIRTAARDVRTQLLVHRIQELIDLDNDTLHAVWGHFELED